MRNRLKTLVSWDFGRKLFDLLHFGTRYQSMVASRQRRNGQNKFQAPPGPEKFQSNSPFEKRLKKIAVRCRALRNESIALRHCNREPHITQCCCYCKGGPHWVYLDINTLSSAQLHQPSQYACHRRVVMGFGTAVPAIEPCWLNPIFTW